MVQRSLAASDAVLLAVRVILVIPPVSAFWIVGLGVSINTGMGVEIVESGFLVGTTVSATGVAGSARGEISLGGAKKSGLK